MGFDIYTKNQPAEIEELSAQLYGDNRPIGEERHRLYDRKVALEEKHCTYFRFSNVGMYECLLRPVG